MTTAMTMTMMMIPAKVLRLLAISAFLGMETHVAGTDTVASACRSNETHIGWDLGVAEKVVPVAAESRSLTGAPDDIVVVDSCGFRDREQSEKEAADYLRKNVMKFDLPKLETLGFGSDDGSDGVDGLSFGIIEPTVKLALDAKTKFGWTDALPQSIFYEYVLNYANTNEARSNWRPYLAPVVNMILEEHGPCSTIAQVVEVVNRHIWTAIAPEGKDSIVFVSGQTPLIFDPMSVMLFGYGSCTGLSILFTNILRTAGVAARVVGTPSWYDDYNQGNHNWVEVYGDDGQWYFLEASPAAGGVDTLDKDPCERWFCEKARFNEGNTSSPVFAARLDQDDADAVYPLAWERSSTDVPGEDRAAYYIETCSVC